MSTLLERCEAVAAHRWADCPNNPDRWQNIPEHADPADRAMDWTAVPNGPSNSSPEFERLVHEVDLLIRQSGHTLIIGGSRSVAGLIMAQLAHVHGLAPRPEHKARP